MNLWLRLVALVVRAWLRPGLQAPFEVSRIDFRVWPSDLDTSLHMNNGRYLTIMDLGRVDLILRTGLWRAVLRQRWTPILGAATIRFRRELRAFQRFRLETRIRCWTGSMMVIEQRMIAIGPGGDESLAAAALMRAALYDREARAHVPVERLMAAIGIDAVSPAPTAEIAAFLAAEKGLRPAW